MKILIVLTVITVLVMVYVVAIRPWLHEKPWAKPFFDWVEPIERVLWWNSTTILFARFKMVVGVLLTVLTSAGAIDITPLMPFVPDQYEPMLKEVWNFLPLTLTILGWIDEHIRKKDTTKPIELVALRTDAPPEVKEAAAEAAAANAKAVELAKETGAV